jgi:hypothetical protein
VTFSLIKMKVTFPLALQLRKPWRRRWVQEEAKLTFARGN